MVKHRKNEFVNGRNHINEIVIFFYFVKPLVTVSRSLQSLGLLNLMAKRENFVIHLKETKLRQKF
nr:hypothetical protein [Campylobacter troglodytis]